MTQIVALNHTVEAMSAEITELKKQAKAKAEGQLESKQRRRAQTANTASLPRQFAAGSLPGPPSSGIAIQVAAPAAALV